MKAIPESKIVDRMRFENPWWLDGEPVGRFDAMQRRQYVEPFLDLLLGGAARRSLILLGPRRVGKTVLMHHVVAHLLGRGVDPRAIAIFSIDHPTYTGLSLEDMINLYERQVPMDGDEGYAGQRYVIFDEVQYHKGWENQLKILTDERLDLQLIVSGSAAAALKLKSNESGAGRFSEFILPPLTFYEYLALRQVKPAVGNAGGHDWPVCDDIDELNRQFNGYINFGGYPEVALSEAVQSDPARFIKSDIIDKVLLRDLPNLYGIGDIQELNSLFTMLAFNTAQEIATSDLAQRSGVAAATIKRYIEYLDAAFLIKTLNRVDRSAKVFQRQRQFKVFLTNPSLRAALFAPATEDDDDYGHLVETAVFAQWFHSVDALASLHYARWSGGEIDVVSRVGHTVAWAVEVKYTDAICRDERALGKYAGFARENGLRNLIVTTKTASASTEVQGVAVEFVPSSLYAYVVGHNVIGRDTATRAGLS